jgi:hypothetical protein
VERPHLGGFEFARRSQRVDSRTPQRLVGVDVPDARDRALVEQRRLHRRAAMRERGGEVACPVARRERLPAEAGVDVRVDLVGLEEEPGAEAADVAIGDLRSVVQSDDRPSVRIVGKRPRRRVPKRPRHPEVNQQRPSRPEPDNQVLAAPLERENSFALELPRNVGGIARPRQARVGDVDALEPPTLEKRCKPCADRLDLG